MPRNSCDNSFDRYTELKEIAKVYSLKSKYASSTNEKKSKYILNNIRKIKKIDNAFSVLCDPYLTIIKNTFFEKNDCYWWIDYYSKTTYYRLRNRAIKSFLAAFNS